MRLTCPGVRHSGRAGFTLVELMMVVVLLGLVMGTMMKVILNQQQFYRGIADVIDTRSSLRQAIDILPNDLRGITTKATSGTITDIYAMTSTSIDFRATFGTSVVCASNGTTTVTVPPFATLASGSVLSSALQSPAVNDSMWIYDDSASLMAAKAVWKAHKITATGTSATGCNASGLASSTAGDGASIVYTVSPNVSATEGIAGAPVRFFKREVYQLYAGTNGQTYLGYYDCFEGRTPQCATVQPVSGPYRTLTDTTSGTSGLHLRYYNVTGASTANVDSVARIGVLVRGQSRGEMKIAGLASGNYRDSLTVVVGVRNRY